MDIQQRPPKTKHKTSFTQVHNAQNTQQITHSHQPTQQPRQTKPRGMRLIARVFVILITALIILAVSAVAYIGLKAYATSKTVNITQNISNADFARAQSQNGASPSNKTNFAQNNTKQNSEQNQIAQKSPSFVGDTFRAAASLVSDRRTPLDGESAGRVNILLLGKGNEFHPGQNLTDTLMIASINTKTKKIALLSLPRDFYVHIPGTKIPIKINALYQYGLTNNLGVGPIIGAIQTLTDLRIHYFLLADFDAFTSIVDALGGINVEVLRNITDTRYPGPNYSYQTFAVKKGLQKMDGATALKYVRSRHGDPEGDFGRAKRQQQTLQAIKNKAFSLGTFANPLTMGKLLDAISDNIRTDMSLTDMSSLMSLTKNLDTQNITTVVVDAWKPNSLLRVSNFGRAFGLVPRAGKYNYNEISELADTIFNRNARATQLRRIATETPKINIIRTGASTKTAQIVRGTIAEALGISPKNIIIKNKIKSANLTPNTIIDHTSKSKMFTLDALYKLLNLKIQTKPNENQSAQIDFSITLGADADDTFSISEITREQFEKAEE